jgi:hypothetical protein
MNHEWAIHESQFNSLISTQYAVQRLQPPSEYHYGEVGPTRVRESEPIQFNMDVARDGFRVGTAER